MDYLVPGVEDVYIVRGDEKSSFPLKDRPWCYSRKSRPRQARGCLVDSDRTRKYRNNASKRPPGRCDCARVERHTPGRLLGDRGVFWGKISDIFAPPDDTNKKKNRKESTRLTHSGSTAATGVGHVATQQDR